MEVREPKEHGILYTPQMLEAVVTDNKTQTRRVVTKHNSECPEGFDNLDLSGAQVENPSLFCDSQYLKAPHKAQDTRHRIFPRYCIGDTLYAKEDHAAVLYSDSDNNLHSLKVYYKFPYQGDNGVRVFKWRDIPFKTQLKIVLSKTIQSYGLNAPHDLPRFRSKLLMFKFMARVKSEITDIRAQRVQEISWQDALAEGVDAQYCCNGADCACRGLPTENPVYGFEALWDSINKERGYPWSNNNFVWAYTFKRIK
jgi:hypothetical protein